MQATGRLEDGYRVRVGVGGFEYVMDRPAWDGGTEQGAYPGEVLAAALAGCNAMVAKTWFHQQRQPLRGLEVVIDTEPDYSKQTGEIHQDFHVTVKVDADLTGEQLDDMLAYVNRMCLVATLLKQENTVTIGAELV